MAEGAGVGAWPPVRALVKSARRQLKWEKRRHKLASLGSRQREDSDTEKHNSKHYSMQAGLRKGLHMSSHLILTIIQMLIPYVETSAQSVPLCTVPGQCCVAPLPQEWVSISTLCFRVHGVFRNEHTPIPGIVAYAEWRRGLYLLINILLSNGLGTGYRKIWKEYSDDMNHNSNKKNPLFRPDCYIHFFLVEGGVRWESMQGWVHTTWN